MFKYSTPLNGPIVEHMLNNAIELTYEVSSINKEKRAAYTTLWLMKHNKRTYIYGNQLY